MVIHSMIFTIHIGGILRDENHQRRDPSQSVSAQDTFLDEQVIHLQNDFSLVGKGSPLTCPSLPYIRLWHDNCL